MLWVVHYYLDRLAEWQGDWMSIEVAVGYFLGWLVVEGFQLDRWVEHRVY